MTRFKCALLTARCSASPLSPLSYLQSDSEVLLNVVADNLHLAFLDDSGAAKGEAVRRTAVGVLSDK